MTAGAVAARLVTSGQTRHRWLSGEEQAGAVGREESLRVASNKILVVDDSPTELAVLSALFQSQGFEVITARDGEDALSKLSSERPRMILLDVIMPGKNGFSLCRQIRSSQDFGQTPVILVTSKDQPSDRFWGLKQGACDYVTKPWDATKLVETVRRHL
jgi:twitching motility two-component system response regulator PilH